MLELKKELKILKEDKEVSYYLEYIKSYPSKNFEKIFR